MLILPVGVLGHDHPLLACICISWPTLLIKHWYNLCTYQLNFIDMCTYISPSVWISQWVNQRSFQGIKLASYQLVDNYSISLPRNSIIYVYDALNTR